MTPEFLRKVAVKIVNEESSENIEYAFRPTTLGGILLRNKDLVAESIMELTPQGKRILDIELLHREVEAVQRWGEDYYKDEGVNI
jgi:hypothetical protein